MGAPRRARTRTAAWALLALLVAAWAAGPALAAAPATRGKVTSVRRGVVYVDLGRADGVRAADQLRAGSARLRIVHLGEKQLSAEVTSGGHVSEGTAVSVPEHGAAESLPSRPVVTLPPAETLPDATVRALWSHPELARRPELVPFEGAATPGLPRERAIAGDVTLLYFGMLDSGVPDLDLHVADLRTRLTVRGMAGGRLDYAHDISGRLWFGPGLDQRRGADSRPNYRIRRLLLRYHSPAWRDEDPAAGAFTATLGRFPVGDSAGPALIDGGSAELGFGRGFALGVHGGLAPDLLDTGFSTDTVAGGGHLRWQAMGDPWSASAAVSAVASTWQGSFDRLDVAATGGFALGGDFDLRAVAVGTLLSDPSVLGRSDFELSRAFVGARGRPLPWLTLDAWYSHWRDVADRETLAAVGLDYLTPHTRDSGWLQLRFDLTRSLELVTDATVGFGARESEHQGASARLVLRDLAPFLPQLSAGYTLSRTPVTLAQMARVDLSMALPARFELGLGYGFSTFKARLLDERLDEHRVDASLYWSASRAFRAQLAASLALGDAPYQLGLTALATWRFR
ncbi:MAG: hypothetical protein H6746_01885 [Deltaproteobacteria bacterium]|nr:hypothetical protein [Deltaproteobacteria bacterium]